jgi:hypothetical protein
MRHRGLLLVGGLVLLVVLLVALRGPQQSGSSPEHSSTSDAPDGTSALRLLTGSLGYRGGSIEGTFDLPPGSGIIFVFSPLQQYGYSNAEASSLDRWIQSGGVVVYASEAGDPQLDQQFGITRQRTEVPEGASATAPVLMGVTRVDGAQSVRPFGSLTPAQVPVLRTASGAPVAFAQQRGSGRLIAMSDPLELCNGSLGRADNGRLAADLLGLAHSGSPALFDEFHHGLQATSSPGNSWMTTSWGASILWAVAVLFIGLLLRGRGFGPRIPVLQRAGRSSAEYTGAVGALLQRTGARSLTLSTLDAATRRAVGERYGVAATSDAHAFAEVLSQRAPATAAELGRLEAQIPGAAHQDGHFLRLAAQLHALAFPDEPREATNG